MSLYRSIVAWINAKARLLNAQSAMLEKPAPKPDKIEVMQTLPDELQEILNMARISPTLRAKLPREFQEMLEEEDAEVTG